MMTIAQRRQETKNVKDALIAAGYTGVSVNHGTGTSWGWLYVTVDAQPGREIMRDVRYIAEQYSGRTSGQVRVDIEPPQPETPAHDAHLEAAYEDAQNGGIEVD